MAIVSDCVNTNAKSIENLWFSFFCDYCKTDAVVILRSVRVYLCTIEELYGQFIQENDSNDFVVYVFILA